MAAPTISSYTPVSAFNNNTATKTVSVSWSSGDLIVFFGEADDFGQTIGTPTATGLTFSSLTSVNVSSSSYVNLYTATAAAAGSAVTISATKSGTAAGFWGFGVYVVSNHLGTGATGTAPTANGTVAITTTAANSAVLAMGVDWNSTAIPTGATPAGASLDTNTNTVNNTVFTYRYPDAGAAGAKTVGGTGGGVAGGKYSMVAVEVKGGAGAVTTGPAFDQNVFNTNVFYTAAFLGWGVPL